MAIDVEVGLHVGDRRQHRVLVGVRIPAVVLATADGDRDVAAGGGGRHRVDVAGGLPAAAVQPDEQLDRSLARGVVAVGNVDPVVAGRALQRERRVGLEVDRGRGHRPSRGRRLRRDRKPTDRAAVIAARGLADRAAAIGTRPDRIGACLHPARRHDRHVDRLRRRGCDPTDAIGGQRPCARSRPDGQLRLRGAGAAPARVGHLKAAEDAGRRRRDPSHRDDEVRAGPSRVRDGYRDHYRADGQTGHPQHGLTPGCALTSRRAATRPSRAPSPSPPRCR